MSDQRDPQRDQPLPTVGRQPVQDALMRAIGERREYGIRKYGRPLETHNGRDALRDAWEEALDLLTYLTQMRLERGDVIGEPAPCLHLSWGRNGLGVWCCTACLAPVEPTSA